MLQKYSKFNQYIQSVGDRKFSYGEKVLIHAYYKQKMMEFMHERLIHLLVTIFVGIALLIITSIILLEKNIILLPIEIVLLLLFCGYIWHYYQLENGLQQLYTLTEIIFNQKNNAA